MEVSSQLRRPQCQLQIIKNVSFLIVADVTSVKQAEL
jgi:hypothetical protein